MPKKAPKATIQQLRLLIDERLALAAAKTMAARKLMDKGHRRESFEVLLEVDSPLYEARAFFSTACAMHHDDD